MKKFPQLLLFFIFNLIYSQQTELKVFNTAINTKYAELGVTLANNNQVIFASSKKNDTDKRHNNRQLHLELYIGSRTQNGDIILSNKFSNELNNKFYESDIAFTPDFKTIYFTWNNFYNTQQRKDSANWKTLFLFKADINNNFEISKVTPLPFNNKNYSIRSPFVSADGKKLFFISDMPSSYGETDIYEVAINADNTYGDPKNLGPTINTEEAEIFPFVDSNNALYFSSFGHKGIGGLDIFKSEYKNGSYQKPEILPSPINSKYDDFAYVINSTNDAGYFTSNRKDSKGDVDIYAFTYNQKECMQNITCTFFNEKTGKNLDHVKVSILENNQLIDNQLVSFGNSYSIKLKCNSNYKIIAEKDNFETTETEIKTTNESTNLEKSINLIPLECNQTITGVYFNSKTKEPIENVQITILENNQIINNQLSNFGNSYGVQLKCNSTYKFIAKKDGFETTEIEVKTSNENSYLDKNILLTPSKCNQTITGMFFNKNTNKLLDNVLVSISQDNSIINKQLIKLGESYNFNLNCNEVYTITATKDNFETSEEIITSNNINNTKLTKPLYLIPIKCEQQLAGVLLDIKTNKPLANAKVEIFEENKSIGTLTLNAEANFNYTLKCNTNYKIIASLKNYTSNYINILTSNKPDETLFKKIFLDTNIEFITLREKKMIKTEPIYFNLDKDDIRKDAAIELNKVVDIMHKYPSIKIEIKSHTDSRAPDNYNLSLSNKRAKSTINYLISKGIETNRITGRGYGETELVNKCSNGVKCTEAEHELNRRTEFIVIEE